MASYDVAITIHHFPTAACTGLDSSTSGNAAGWRVGRCRKHILLASGFMVPRRAAAVPTNTPCQGLTLGNFSA